MKNNISRLNDCYGCGVCVIACPTKIIDLIENKDGFYSPIINDQEKCIECGICLEICAYNHDSISVDQSHSNIKAFGCWSKNDKTRSESTTAGLAMELAKNALREDRQVCAVRYNINKIRAEHFIVNTEKELHEAQGSKYLPSFTIFGFRDISLKKRAIIFGLPCQIDSFRRLIRRYNIEQNFQLVDLLCHGVPSLLIWRKYIKEEQNKFGEIKRVLFRSKHFGWHKSACIEIIGTKGTFIQPAKHDLFYKTAFSDICLNKCCQGKCKYKLTSSAADIRIGDYWGKKYESSYNGVNLLLSLTPMGDKMVDVLKKSCVFEDSSIEDAMDRQQKTQPSLSPLRTFGLACLRRNWPLRIIYPTIKYGNLILNPRILIKKIINKL